MKRASIGVVAVAAAGVAWSPASAAPPATTVKKGEPVIEQMVVFRNREQVPAARVRAKRTTVKVGKRTCAVAAATPLAALLRARRLGRMRLRDYGSCSRKPADSSGLFVRAIRRDRNSGLNGWVYKVGAKLGTAGAADPAGPFGDGRLRTGDQVVWFYCVFHEGSCQRSLGVRTSPSPAGTSIAVTGYDDSGEGKPIAGARVAVEGPSPRTETTGADGTVTLALPPGDYRIQARKSGLIPSFPRQARIP